jgi:hypothetical protein
MNSHPRRTLGHPVPSPATALFSALSDVDGVAPG